MHRRNPSKVHDLVLSVWLERNSTRSVKIVSNSRRRKGKVEKKKKLTCSYRDTMDVINEPYRRFAIGRYSHSRRLRNRFIRIVLWQCSWIIHVSGFVTDR